MSILTKEGILRERLDKILSKVNAIFRDSYSQEINLSESTPDAQIAGIFSESLSNLYEGCQSLFDNFNPNSSTGVNLDRLVELNGLTRIPRTPTNVILDLLIDTGGIEVIIPAPVYVNSPDGNNPYVIPEDIFAPVGGTIQVYAEATEFDTPIVPANTLTVVTTSTGYTIICNNTEPSVVGRDEETDSELRMRRYIDSSFSGDSSTDKLYSALINLPNTLDCTVLENSGFATPINVPDHSVLVIVRPLLTLTATEISYWQEEVADTMLDNITVGTGTNNTFYPNKKTIVSTSRQGFTSIMYFIQATEASVDIVVNVTELDGFPTNGEQLIKEEIIKYVTENIKDYGLGSTVITNKLYIPCHKVPGHTIDSMTTSIAGGLATADNKTLDINEAPNFDINNITVNVT